MARNFDTLSGQVYTETTSRHGRMTADWVLETVGRPKEYACWRSKGLGCAPLVNMATRSALANINSITAESLERIPWRVGMRLWRKIVVTRLDSLRIWKVFLSVYSREHGGTLMRKQQVIFAPNGRFSSYITPLISTSIQWITLLTLSEIVCSRTDLLQLSRLTNLGVLTIGDSVDCLDGDPDDSMIRLWSRAAAESDAFSNLRILNCGYQRDITGASLHYLRSFPSLALFTYENVGISSWDLELALSLGWKPKMGYYNSGFLSLARHPARHPTMEPYFREDGWLNIKQGSAEGVETLDVIPILHFILGDATRTSEDHIDRDQNIISFHRIENHNVATSNSLKRPSRNEGLEQRSGAGKKPRMRPSKQKGIEEMLTDFGS